MRVAPDWEHHQSDSSQWMEWLVVEIDKSGELSSFWGLEGKLNYLVQGKWYKDINKSCLLNWLHIHKDYELIWLSNHCICCGSQCWNITGAKPEQRILPVIWKGICSTEKYGVVMCWYYICQNMMQIMTTVSLTEGWANKDKLLFKLFKALFE